MEGCKLSCIRATDFLCLSVTYNPAEANGQCSMNRVTSNTVDPTSDFEKPCERGPDNIRYAGRRVKGFLEWTDPVYACIRGNNQRNIGNVLNIEECQQRCVDATGYWCLSIDYDTRSNRCFLNRVNSHTVIPSSDFTQPCYNYPDDVLCAERRIEEFLEWTDSVLACIDGNNTEAIRNVPAISDCQQHCSNATGFLCLSVDYRTRDGRCWLNKVNSVTVHPPNSYHEPCDDEENVRQYAERRVTVSTTMASTTTNAEFASAMSPVVSSDKSGPLPTSEISSQSGSGNPGEVDKAVVAITVAVIFGVVIASIAVIFAVRRCMGDKRNDSDDITRNDQIHAHLPPSNGPGLVGYSTYVPPSDSGTNSSPTYPTQLSPANLRDASSSTPTLSQLITRDEHGNASAIAGNRDMYSTSIYAGPDGYETVRPVGKMYYETVQ